MSILPYSRLFFRGCAQVALVSANVVQVASGQYVGAFMVGTAISMVWYSNTRSVIRVDLPGAGLCYGVGAGVGTILGMYLARLW